MLPSLYVGFESLSQPGLRHWKKQGNLGKDYLSVVKKLHEQGIAVCAEFVFGCDEDSPEVFEQTVDFLLEANADL
jgi:radical SAM superfamily enzyme